MTRCSMIQVSLKREKDICIPLFQTYGYHTTIIHIPCSFLLEAQWFLNIFSSSTKQEAVDNQFRFLVQQFGGPDLYR